MSEPYEKITPSPRHLPPTTLTATGRSQLSGNSPHSPFSLKGEGKEKRRKGYNLGAPKVGRQLSGKPSPACLTPYPYPTDNADSKMLVISLEKVGPPKPRK